MRSSNLFESFRYAFRGLLYGFKTQRNLRIHGFVGLLVLILAVSLGTSVSELAMLCLTIAVVIAAELFNTAVETVVDLVTKEYHPLAAISKNLAAGAVLIVASGAAVVGGLIFSRYLVVIPPESVPLPIRSTVVLTLIGVVFVVLLVLSIKAAFGHQNGLHGGMPSGHVALASGLATAIYFVGASPAAVIFAAALVFVVAQSRLETGVHSLLEVTMGLLLGILVTTGIFRLMLG